MSSCSNNCNGHGICDFSQCICEPEWFCPQLHLAGFLQRWMFLRCEPYHGTSGLSGFGQITHAEFAIRRRSGDPSGFLISKFHSVGAGIELRKRSRTYQGHSDAHTHTPTDRQRHSHCRESTRSFRRSMPLKLLSKQKGSVKELHSKPMNEMAKILVQSSAKILVQSSSA